MSQLTEFFKNKQKKKEYDIDSIDINNTSYEDIISNYDLNDEDVEMGRAIYNKELSLNSIDRAKSQAQQGIQNQYSLKNKYQNYLRSQNGLDTSVAAVQSGDLSLRSKLLSQLGAVNNNALNSTLAVNQNYYDIKREIISRYDAQRQANYDNWMVDTTGVGDNLQNIETYDSTYRYDTIGDVAISKTDYDLAKKWLDEQEKKGTLSTGKISELKQKLVEWESKLTEVPEEKVSPTVEFIKSGIHTIGHRGRMGWDEFKINGKKVKMYDSDAVKADSVGITQADFEKNGEWKILVKNGQTYLANAGTHGITVYEIEV